MPTLQPSVPAVPQDLSQSVQLFLETLIGVVQIQAKTRGDRLSWIVDSAGMLSDSLRQDAAIEEIGRAAQTEMADLDERSTLALAVLETEMRYCAFAYRQVLSAEHQEVVVQWDQFPDVSDDADLADAADTLEVVGDSFQRQLRKLPKWLQRFVEVLRELLKIAKLGG